MMARPRCSLLIISSFVMVVLAYLAVVNDTAAVGHSIAQERALHEKLQTQAQDLEMKLAEYQRWDVLAPKIAELGLVEHGGVVYAESSHVHTFAANTVGTAVAR